MVEKNELKHERLITKRVYAVNAHDLITLPMKGGGKMSSFRCPFYHWDSTWYCLKIGESITCHDFDTYCCDERKYVLCPYFQK